MKDTVHIHAIFPASPAEVWKAWTDPDLLLRWFGSDPEGKGLHARTDLRKGGDFEISFEDSDQTRHTCSGVYTEVEVPVRLSFTWKWKSAPDAGSLVSLRFAPHPAGTVMDFEHADLDEVSGHNYLQGWKSTFAKLERLFISRAFIP